MSTQAPPPAAPPRSAARWVVPLALLFLFAASCGGLGLLLLGAVLSSERVARGTVLELDLSGGLPEAPDPLSGIFPGLAETPSLFEIRKALTRAGSDPAIVALRVDLEGLEAGWGAAEELVAALDEFRSTGKPVHALLAGDLVQDVEYLVALGADRVWTVPQASFLVNGLRAEVEFWRGTLGKLDVVPQFYMMREYKSAGEVWMNEEMSPAFRESTAALLEDIWASFLARLAERRRVDPERAREVADVGLLTAEQAREAQWVDAVGPVEELERELREKAGTARYQGLSVRDYLGRSRRDEALSRRRRIAVVIGEGVIVSRDDESPFSELFSGPRVARAVRRAADDERVAGIILRVDSPGGAPVGSDHVWAAVDYARREKKKPVVVSMSSVAASGGYWVSAGADAIVARPTTITGSIGVVFGKFNLLGLYRKVGANVDGVAVGENADLLSFVSSFDEEQEPVVLAWMTALYDDFKEKVAAGRGLDPGKVEEVARGRVWSGVDAAELGLVDRLGGYGEATSLVREKAGVPVEEELELVAYPKPKSLLELLFDGEVGAEVRALRARLAPARTPRAEVERLLGELGRPGAWLLAPTLRVR